LKSLFEQSGLTPGQIAACTASRLSSKTKSHHALVRNGVNVRAADTAEEFHMLLIVGGDSEVGAAALGVLKGQGHAAAATTRRRDLVSDDRPFLDLGTSLASFEPPQGTTSACICAAVARLGDCAADPQASAHINVTQTLTLIERLLARGIYVLFLSTNRVFDGRVPQVPPDAPHSPVSEYGRQKARTESALNDYIARGAPIGILRLAKVVSARTPLFRTWIADLPQGKAISAFADLTIAPTEMTFACNAIGTLLSEQASGIFQLTGPRDVSYADVGRFLAAKLGVDSSLVQETSARSAELPEGTILLHTTLDYSALCKRLGLEVPDVWQVIESVTRSAVSQSRTMQNAG
jgi:dTDP-4-dehydrorhamnose reductase